MAASAAECILDRAFAVLTAGLPSRTRVERYRGDAQGIADMPCIVLRRQETRHDQAAFENVQVSTDFEIDCYVAAGEGTETAADALHLAAHVLLMADAELAALGRNTLACTGTELETDRADYEATRLTARYTIDSWVLQADLSTVP